MFIYEKLHLKGLVSFRRHEAISHFGPRIDIWCQDTELSCTVSTHVLPYLNFVCIFEPISNNSYSSISMIYTGLLDRRRENAINPGTVYL